jgi:hypothetical protein
MSVSALAAAQGGSENIHPANVAVGRMPPRPCFDLPTISRGAAAIVPVISRQTL